MHINQSSAMIVTWCLCDACGNLSQICASNLHESFRKEDFKPSWVPFKYFPFLKMCTWSLHVRLVLPVLTHKIQSYILGKKISNLHGSLSWEPTQSLKYIQWLPQLSNL